MSDVTIGVIMTFRSVRSGAAEFPKATWTALPLNGTLVQ